MGKLDFVYNNIMNNKDVINRIEDSRLERCEYLYNLCGLNLYCHRDVFSPKYHKTTKTLIDLFPFKKGSKLLEIGCGVMALGIFAAKNFSNEVTGVDINKKAVEIAQKNISINKVSDKAKVFYSNLFSKVDSKFNMIFWDYPFVLSDQVKTMHDRAFFSTNYDTLAMYVKFSFDYLLPGGRVFLGFGSTGDEDLLNYTLDEFDCYKVHIGQEFNKSINTTSFLYEIRKNGQFTYK